MTKFIYYDDIQVVNPVGNKTKRNHLGAFYFSLGTSPFRSRKRHIFLLALLRTSYLKEHKAIVRRTIVDDCKTLENKGISVQRGGETVSVKGSVALFIGDNLAVHTIGGFLESFSHAQRVSLYCLCSSDDIQDRFTVKECTLRTSEEYDAQIRDLERSGFHQPLCNSVGIKSECPFNALSSFHIVHNAPPDIAHDIYECLLPIVISAVPPKFIKDKTLNLDQINKSITTFPYAQEDSQNPPQSLSCKNGTIKCSQTAKEGLNLWRLLPLAVGYLVPKGNLT